MEVIINRKLKIIVGSISVVLIIGLGLLAWYLVDVHIYEDKVASINISDVDLTKIPDGTYLGDCDVDFIHARVEVTVQEGTIADIKLLEQF